MNGHLLLAEEKLFRLTVKASAYTRTVWKIR